MQRALAFKADYAQAWLGRGLALHARKRLDEARECFDRAIQIQPDYFEAHNNRGVVLNELNRMDEALDSFAPALKAEPNYVDAYSNRGNALRALNRLDEACDSYRHALAIKPDYAEAHFNLSLCQLLGGDLERGWEGYEWRWKIKGFPLPVVPQRQAVSAARDRRLGGGARSRGPRPGTAVFRALTMALVI